MSLILLERLRATAEATSKSWKKASISHCVPFCDQTSNCSHCSIDRVPKCGWKGGTPEILDRIAAKKTSAAIEAGYGGYRRVCPRAWAEEVRRCGGGPAVWLRFLQPGPGKPFGPVPRRHRSGGGG